MTKRLVLKVGTNVLTTDDQKLDLPRIEALADQIVALRRAGWQVLLVSSGSVGAAAGLIDGSGHKDELTRRMMLSAIGQPRLMSLYAAALARRGVLIAQALLSRSDFQRRERYLNICRVLQGLLRFEVLPIINENDVITNEALTFGDNDYLAAAVASMMDAEHLFLLTTARGFYLEGPPETHAVTSDCAPDCVPEYAPRPLRVVEGITPPLWKACQRRLQPGSRGGMLSKLKSIELATGFGITCHVACGKLDDAVSRILAGEAEGTTFLPTAPKPPSYRRWLRFGALETSRLIIDDGAAEALRRNKSLLIAGILRVQGAFREGDVVEIHDDHDRKLGVGLVAYPAEALLKRIETKRSESRQGRATQASRTRPAVHKDRLLLV